MITMAGFIKWRGISLMSCILFLEVLSVMTSLVRSREEPYVTLARCRIACVKKFVVASKMTDDNACWDTNNHRSSYSKKCSNCWTLCKTFAGNPDLMVQACNNRKLCNHGCRQSCQFFSQSSEVLPASKGEWAFPAGKEVDITTDAVEMHIRWHSPGLVSKDIDNADIDDVNTSPIVYVLLTRNNNKPQDGWQMIMQMLSTSVRIDLDVLPLSPEFLLLAVSRDGLVTQMEFKPRTIVIGDISDPSGPRYRKLLQEEEAGWYLKSVNEITANVTLKSKVVRSPEGSHKVETAEVRFRGLDWLANESEKVYDLRWIFLDCERAYDFVPRCENHPRDNYGSTVVNKGNETSTYNIRVKFNSIYLLVIYLSEDYRVKVEVVFKTSPCLQPDPLQWNRCLDEIEEEDLPSIPVKKARDDRPVPQVAQLAVNISSMQLVPVDERTLVQVNFTWSPLLNETLISYNVTAQKNAGDDKMMVSILETPSPFIVLNLEQNQQYTVQVEAFSKQPNSSSWKNNILWDTVEFNTSDVSLPMYQRPQAYQIKHKSDSDSVQGIVIGVTCVVLSIVLLILLIILYKKRQSFKDILDTKATVAKSNSYKSNVGGKSDYSNQLIVFADDWELDPQRLKFSHLLGQGAFGKVVTGYYDDQKVAIKLVREGAPISYKEDLVAEINLMKRIGSHPNIVCLIGACTLSEPIALIMEYVPYGNLQYFLKKCRLEGDVQKTCDGPSEITYTVMQDSGSEESGVVTPADMLSFARQVSMAMEYLAEKKYVHRDLAARNVLIDYNKVVKVCDFGLSRDIYNDDHYKKLTNGKLPLKWMAIESLRDRIFTTQSDVWSFGILLWEIVTMGASPYPNVALADLYYVLSNGYRMTRPSNCSEKLYSIMSSCWEEDPRDRPSFTGLRLMLEDLLSEDRDYLVLEDIDVPITNSDNSSSPSPIQSAHDTTTSNLGHMDGAVGGQTSPMGVSCLPSLDSQSAIYPMAQSITSMQPFASTSSASSSPMRSSLTSLLPAAVSNPLPPPPPPPPPQPLPQQSAVTKTSHTKSKKASPRRDNLCIKVCIHQKSTDRLIRHSESDSSPSSS